MFATRNIGTRILWFIELKTLWGNLILRNNLENLLTVINRYKRIGYDPYIMRQTAYQVVNLITVDSYALLLNCTAVVRASDSMPLHKSFHKWVGA